MSALCQKLAVIFIVTFVSVNAPAASPGWRPSATVEIISAASPGSVHDRLARVTAQIMRDGGLVSSTLIVTNKSGAGGTVALGYLSQGHGNLDRISTASEALLTNHITGFTDYNYTDFTVLAMLFNDYNIFTVRKDSSIKDGADLLAKLKSDPKSVSFAFATSLGNYNHIAIAKLAKAVNTDIRQVLAVVYRGGGQAMTAVLGGQIDVLVGGPGNVIGQLQAGRLRAIAVSSPQRYELEPLANVPTWREQGVDVVASNAYYFLGSKGLKREQIEFWDQVFSKFRKTSEWRNFVKKNLVIRAKRNQNRFAGTA